MWTKVHGRTEHVKGAPMAKDLYSRLDEIDDASLESIARMLERRGNHPQQVAIRNTYLDSLGDLAGRHVLEIGCGTGVVTRELSRRVGPTGRLVASDPSHGMIGIARRLAREADLSALDLQVQDARSLPYPDATFDVTCAITVLSHVPEREAVLREMARVTRPGGRVLIVDGDFAANQIEHPDREMTAAIVDAWRANIVDDPYLTRRLAPLLRDVGLRIDAMNGHLHIEVGQVDEATSFMWQWAVFAAQQGVQAGVVTEEQAAAWTEEVRALNARGLLFGSITFISFVCHRD
jgi:ubiquinone/menaquinone biosynthesis C-methylase UbiE